MDLNPDKFEARRSALIVEINANFASVTLGNGLSWSQTYEIDNYEADEVIEAARTRDQDTHWRQLVDDPGWSPSPGIGGFNFIDNAGFRYYFPAAMIRIIRDPLSSNTLESMIGIIDRYRGLLSDLFDQQQIRTIARFVKLMTEHPVVIEEYLDMPTNHWQVSFDTFWHSFAS
jgi:hypothetical protein